MPATSRQLTATADDLRIAWLAALAVAIHVLEAAFPSPLPGVKPGLANVVVIMALLLYGWRAALSVAVLRVVAGSLFLGTFLSPTFLLSLSGALAALAALGLAWAIAGHRLSAIGLSVIAALAHMTGQFLVAWGLFIPTDAIWRLYPILMSASLIFGLVSGTIAQAIIRQLTTTTE
ncbi:MAG: Gx transporter family protein [Gammaproteobacteria bacterium]|nr:Gx transporter family protein [Gammaproteobacteria bacterium]MDX5375706.1 Gx transporter family protein [Gammaproteobacteria bacterium]